MDSAGDCIRGSCVADDRDLIKFLLKHIKQLVVGLCTEGNDRIVALERFLLAGAMSSITTAPSSKEHTLWLQ